MANQNSANYTLRLIVKAPYTEAEHFRSRYKTTFRKTIIVVRAQQLMQIKSYVFQSNFIFNWPSLWLSLQAMIFILKIFRVLCVDITKSAIAI